MGTGEGVNPFDSLWLAGLSFIVWLFYLDHLYHAIRLYAAEKSYRAFRNSFIAVMLQVGLTRIAIGSLQIAFPDQTFFVDLRNWTAPMLTFLLLTGAVVLAYTWRKDDTLHRAEDAHDRGDTIRTGKGKLRDR